MPGADPLPMDLTPEEAAGFLREIVAGTRPLRAADPRRSWSTTACGPFAVLAGGWHCVFHAEDGSLERLDSIRSDDGREGVWTRWLAEGSDNPVMLLDDGEQQELESLLQACR
jgi:hypothetical protein